MSDVPHFALPFRFIQGSAVTLEQDTIEEIGQCVQVLVETPVGSRLEVPDYGIVDPTFAQSVDMSNIADALTEWEPRALAVLSESPEFGDELLRNVQAVVHANQGET